MVDAVKQAVGWELAEYVLDGVMLTAPDGRIFAANRVACELLGRSEEDICASGRHGLVEPGDPSLPGALAERERTGSVSGDLRMIKGDGSLMIAEYASRVFAGPDGEKLAVLTFRDVSGRRGLERDLAESEARFRALSDASFEAVAVHIDGLLVDANEQFRELFGIGRESFGTLTAQDMIAPESRPAANAFIADRGHGPVELELLRADGTTFHGEVRGRDALVGGVPARVVSIRDVEGRRRAEAERADNAARAAELERVNSLSVLAGGIAHEFNNTLHVALAGIELARDDVTTDEEARQLLATVEASLAHAVELSRAMLAYTGRQSVVREWIDLAVLVTAAAARVVGTPPPVEVEERPFVHVDAEAIAGAFSVLLENAADATATGGSVTVRVGAMELGEDEAATAHPVGEVGAGPYAFVEVADSGTGMEHATRARMFDPFFSTRFPGRGLGLAAALGVARAHRGGFLVRSEPGRGTSVRLLVPVG